MKNSFDKLSYDELVSKRDELYKSLLQMRRNVNISREKLPV